MSKGVSVPLLVSIMRTFSDEAGYFKGPVTSYETETGLYTIVYEDTDQEQVHLKDLVQMKSKRHP